MSSRREAPVEVMRELCEAVDAAAVAADDPRGCPPELFERAFRERCEALAAYRAAIAPKLRTRAEVDAEIATIVRTAYGSGTFHIRCGCAEVSPRVEELCREQTAPEPPQLIDCEFPEPDPVPCDCVVLRDQLHRIRALAQPVGGSVIPTRAERALQQILEVLG